MGHGSIVTKRADNSPAPFLTREQIDEVIGSMAAADLISAIGDGESLQGAAMAGAAFDSAAARLGMSNGTPATEHVAMRDFAYMANAIGEAVNVESPLSEGQDA